MAKRPSGADLPEVTRRQAYSRETWEQIEYTASIMWAFLNGSNNPDVPQITKRACIYVTGSFAREEASEGSDLDLFVLDDLPKGKSLQGQSLGHLSYVENAHLIAALDNVRAEVGLRRFSRGGEFIKTHSFRKLLGEIGSPQDDATNAFTARVLLLTNSKPLLNAKAHTLAKKLVLDSYWDRSDPNEPFFPIMLTNDLRRWWGVLCLNFERNNRLIASDDFESTPERRLEDLKLRYTKMLGVYSTILGLIDVAGDRGILRADAETIFDAFPIDRLLKVESNYASSDSKVSKLTWDALVSYDEYLAFSAQNKETLLEKLSEDSVWRERKDRAYEFHDKFVRLLNAVGRDRILYEYCIV